MFVWLLAHLHVLDGIWASRWVHPFLRAQALSTQTDVYWILLDLKLFSGWIYISCVSAHLFAFCSQLLRIFYLSFTHTFFFHSFIFTELSSNNIHILPILLHASDVAFFRFITRWDQACWAWLRPLLLQASRLLFQLNRRSILVFTTSFLSVQLSVLTTLVEMLVPVPIIATFVTLLQVLQDAAQGISILYRH